MLAKETERERRARCLDRRNDEERKEKKRHDEPMEREKKRHGEEEAKKCLPLLSAFVLLVKARPKYRRLCP